MLFFNSTPIFKRVSYSKILKKYKPSPFEDKIQLIRYRGFLPYFGVIQHFMCGAINLHIKYVVESEKVLLKRNKKLIYSTSFDFFVILFSLFERKNDYRGVDPLSLSSVLKFMFSCYFDEFIKDNVHIYRKVGSKPNEQYTFDTFYKALNNKKKLYDLLLARLNSCPQSELFEAYKTLYVFLIVSPSIKIEDDDFNNSKIQLLLYSIIGIDPHDQFRIELGLPGFITCHKEIITLFRNVLDAVYEEIDYDYNSNASFDYILEKVWIRVNEKNANSL